MSISIVNGYVCYSCCDVAKAKHGEDPHKTLGQVQDDPAKPGAAQDPAVVFGGALAEKGVTSPALKADVAAPAPANAIDLLA